MNPVNHSAARKSVLLLLLLALGAALSAGGCVYRPNIQQGNLLEVKDVDQVTPGMTRSQVRYLLGTPMIADPFDPQRWDYVYTFKRGRERKGDRAHFVVHFANDKVSQVDKLDLPDDRGTGGKKKDRKNKKQVAKESREPPPLPSISQPRPDAPRPGGNSN
jgi:outer membrane protein assembly factor BamE